MKTTNQFQRDLLALAARSAALVLVLASTHLASAQLNNTSSGPFADNVNGAGAGAGMTSGDDNTAYGFSALQLTTTGLRNTAIGSLALKNNKAGSNNTAVGYGALTVSIATGNTAIGYATLFKNTSGASNTASGFNALYSNTTGSLNMASGRDALRANTTGASNVANGHQALFSNTTGDFNVAIGDGALLNSTTGLYNTASGASALALNTTGGSNTATGASALFYNTIGSQNMASGGSALQSNTGGSDNAASGIGALFSNTTGNENTACGFDALALNTTGSNNIGLGSHAGYNLTTGDNNIDIGNQGVAGEGATIRIGTKGTHTAAYIAGINLATVPGGVPVRVDSTGHLGTLTSSRRFKKDIASMDAASDALLSLRPVTFRYKTDLDPDGIPQFGLIAEEVEKVAPELVARDDKGETYTVRYEAVNAMLLNEFLKEHRRVEAEVKTNTEQAKTIAELRQRIAALEARDHARVTLDAELRARLTRLENALDNRQAPTRAVNASFRLK